MGLTSGFKPGNPLKKKALFRKAGNNVTDRVNMFGLQTDYIRGDVLQNLINNNMIEFDGFTELP
jgi:hypothetical protein